MDNHDVDVELKSADQSTERHPGGSLDALAPSDGEATDPMSASPAAPQSTGAPSPRPSLVRQRNVAVQRLRLSVSDKQSCSVVLQRLQILHKRNADAASASLQRAQQPQRHGRQREQRQPRGDRAAAADVDSASGSRSSADVDTDEEMFEDAAEYGDGEGAELDSEDGVLVEPPGVQLSDCLLAVSASEHRLAIAHATHLFLHPLHAATTAIAHSAASLRSTADHYLDEYGEVSQEQRVQVDWAQAQTGDHAVAAAATYNAAGHTVDSEQCDEGVGDEDGDSITARLQRDVSSISALCWYRCEQRDWLLVGYGSGMLRCYHSNGRLAFAHCFHPSPIQHIKYFATANSQLSNLSDSLIHTGTAMNDSSVDERLGALSTAVSVASRSTPTSSSSSSAPAKHRFDVLVVHSDSLCVIGGKSIRAYLRVDLSAHSQLLATSRRDNIALSLHNLQQMKDGIWRHNKCRTRTQQHSLAQARSGSRTTPHNDPIRRG